MSDILWSSLRTIATEILGLSSAVSMIVLLSNSVRKGSKLAEPTKTCGVGLRDHKNIDWPRLSRRSQIRHRDATKYKHFTGEALMPKAPAYLNVP